MDVFWTIIYMIGIFVLFYFLFVHPQKKRQKKHQEMISNLKVNDKVITIGGILGTIIKVKEDTVVLRVADNIRFELLKTAVADKRSDNQEEEKKDGK